MDDADAAAARRLQEQLWAEEAIDLAGDEDDDEGNDNDDDNEDDGGRTFIQSSGSLSTFMLLHISM